MKHIYKLFAFVLMAGSAATAAAQGIYISPSPVDLNAEDVRLYIDLTSEACSCPNLIGADPETMPLYIWTWEPLEMRPELNGENVNNGIWNDSNENMKLKQDEADPDLWYYDFLGASLTDFYGVDAAAFSATGISFLLKTKDGSQQTSDKNIQLSVLSANDDDRSPAAGPDIFPNPAVDELRIRFSGNFDARNAVASVFSADGRLVMQVQNAAASDNGAVLNVSGLPKGMYILRLTSADGSAAVSKFVKR